MSKTWHPYFEQRVKNLFNALHTWSADKDPASLHDLRVEIKKLLAILRFLRKIYPGQKIKKEADEVKQIFRELGQLREYHLLQQWLRDHQLDLIQKTYFPEGDVEAFSMELAAKSNRFYKRLKQCVHVIGNLIADTNDILIEQYTADLYDRISKTVRKDLPASEWHMLRKKMKQWLYANDWLSVPKDRKKEKKRTRLHELEEAIGKWHDLEVIRDTLSQRELYLSNDLPLQLCFTQASDQLKRSIQYRKRKVLALLAEK